MRSEHILAPRSWRAVAMACTMSAATLFAQNAMATEQRLEPSIDCPLAKSAYSVDAPLYDLLLDPRARDALKEAGLLDRLPAFVITPKTPSFSIIISPRVAVRLLKLPADRLATLDQRLRAIPVRPQDMRKRCERYTEGPPPSVEIVRGEPAILVFDGSSGFRDNPSVEAATAALRAIGERKGWQLVFTSSPTAFDPAFLRRFDAVVWNNVSGDVLTLGQRRALRRYVERGGGFFGVHGSGGDPVYWWDWYADTLIGARFLGHPMAPQFQSAQIHVENRNSPLAHGLSTSWTMTDEWYSFERSPRAAGATVLLTIDEASYNPGDLRMGDHPIAWTRCVKAGRSFYSAIGHRPETYSDPSYRIVLERGLEWAAGRLGPKCRASG